MKVVHFLGVQPALPGAWKMLVLCGGGRKETDWKVRFYCDSAAIFHDYSAILPIVRRLRSNRTAIATKWRWIPIGVRAENAVVVRAGWVK